MSGKLTKRQCDLVDEAVKLSRIRKDAETRLEEIKIFLESLLKDTYTTPKGGVLLVGEKDSWEVVPIDLLNNLKKKKLSEKFFDCITVGKTKCDTILGKATYEELKVFVKSVKSFSFR